jgi:putative phosphoesterase
MRPEAIEALKDTELIIHAGDIGSLHVLENLRTIAPVVAVRGNIDREQWAKAQPKREVVEIARTRLYVIHDLNEIDLDPAAAGFSAIISGHSHQPSIQTRKGVLLLNPGSAGPRRFNLPVSVALIYVKDGMLEAQVIELRTGIRRG